MSDFVQGGNGKPAELGGDQEWGNGHASTQADGYTLTP